MFTSGFLYLLATDSVAGTAVVVEDVWAKAKGKGGACVLLWQGPRKPRSSLTSQQQATSDEGETACAAGAHRTAAAVAVRLPLPLASAPYQAANGGICVNHTTGMLLYQCLKHLCLHMLLHTSHIWC